MFQTVADDNTPYDLEARETRKYNLRAQRRLQTYLRQMEKFHKSRLQRMEREIIQTKIEARTFKFEKDRSAFNLFQKYHKLATDLGKRNDDEEVCGVPIGQPVRFKTVYKTIWQNPESEEFKSKVREENKKRVASDVIRRIQSEPPPPRTAVKYGRLDLPLQRENTHVRSDIQTDAGKISSDVYHKLFGYTNAYVKKRKTRPTLVSEGSRLNLKQRHDLTKTMPMSTNPATAQIHALWESNKCLVRGHVPAGGIHFDIPCVKGRSIQKSPDVDTEGSNSHPNQPADDPQDVAFRLPEMEHLAFPQKQRSSKKETELVSA